MRKICGLLRDMIEDNDNVEEEIPLINIPATFLKDIIDYCNHYNFSKVIDIPSPLPSS